MGSLETLSRDDPSIRVLKVSLELIANLICLSRASKRILLSNTTILTELPRSWLRSHIIRGRNNEKGLGTPHNWPFRLG
jgi:hypothetical protein